MSEMADWPVATKTLLFDGVIAHNPGDRVPPANVEANGWQESVAKPDSSAADFAEAVAAGNYDALKVDQLRDLATERGLDAAGNKSDLVARLQAAHGEVTQS